MAQLPQQTLFDKAIEFDDKGDIKTAIEFYNKSAEIEQNVIALFNLGVIYESLDDISTAIKFYKLACDKNDVDALNNLATIYIIQKEYELAKECLLKSVKVEHVNLESQYYNLGILYMCMGKFNNMKKWFTKAIAIYKHKPSLKYLFNYYKKNNNTSEIINLFNMIDNKSILTTISINDIIDVLKSVKIVTNNENKDEL